jgi:DNA-binding CsgD family transcriptional regulator
MSLSPLVELSRRDWDTFLHVFVAGFSLDGAPPEVPYWRDSITQDDWLRMVGASRQMSLADLLPQVSVPTLVLNTRRLRAGEPAHELGEQGQLVASLVPDSRLILFDGFAGAWYSSNDEAPAAVLAIEAFARELGLVEPEAPGAGAAETMAPPALPATALSPREVEILRLIAAGHSNQEIATGLVLSVRTVERHISNLYVKIGARRKADATAYALRNGFA